MTNDIYLLVGMIIENVQSIEYDLIELTKVGKVLKIFERNKSVSKLYQQHLEEETKALTIEMTNMSFGQIMKIIKENELLQNDDVEYLESILSKRNQLVHKFFKQSQVSNATYETKLKYLNKFLDESITFKKYLNDLIKEKQNDLGKVIYE